MAAAPAAWLRVPGIGLSTLVRRGAAAADLLRSPCVVLEATGVTVVAAHRDKHFRALRRVRGGERVQWEAPDGTRQVYRIVDTEVLSPDRVAARLAEQDANGPWLVLMTCHPFRYIGPAPNRFLAWAREESRAVGEAASDSHRPASSALPLPEAEASEELPRERGTPTRPPIACISSRPEYRLPVSAEALDAVQRRRRKPEALRGLQAAFPSVAA
jgi:LPXTG-site transpeptidase (sortase) family protein